MLASFERREEANPTHIDVMGDDCCRQNMELFKSQTQLGPSQLRQQTALRTMIQVEMLPQLKTNQFYTSFDPLFHFHQLHFN